MWTVHPRRTRMGEETKSSVSAWQRFCPCPNSAEKLANVSFLEELCKSQAIESYPTLKYFNSETGCLATRGVIHLCLYLDMAHLRAYLGPAGRAYADAAGPGEH